MADSSGTGYSLKFREDEEMEFFTELALHETERWIQAVTKKSLPHSDDTRKSLANGVLLCELLNCLQPGSVSRINRLSTPIAGLDNINVFLRACKAKFGLSDVHLFNPSDLEDLSQRAIGESATLKLEYEKRLRNVAITIYWLGKYANQHYQGPQLDLSAYSALIHHRQEPEIVDQDFSHEHAFISRTSSFTSGDWPPLSHHNSRGQQSFLESTDSLEEATSDVGLNLSRSFISPLSKTQEQAYGGRDQNTTSTTINSPHTSITHRRYSSTDSMDSSHHSGQSSHSRQGSDSQEMAYPTRRLSRQTSQKQSSITDPLQFIKLKGAQNLAHTAEVQMRVAAESKLGSARASSRDEEPDWQAELSNWKNRRKSQSERTYHMSNPLEKVEPEKDNTQIKTFSQMQKEKEQRKSSRQWFYPTKDDDDDALIMENSQSFSSYLKDENFVSTEDSNKEDNKRCSDKPCVGNQSDTNNNFSNLLPSENSVITSVSYLSHTPEHFNDDYNGRNIEGDTDNDKQHQKHPPGLITESTSYSNRHINKDKTNECESKSKNGSFVLTQNKLEQKENDFISRDKKVFTLSKPYSNRDFVPKIVSQNIGLKNQGKIGSYLKNLEESSMKVTLPKQGYNEKVDLNSRKNNFEVVSENDIDPFNYQSDKINGRNNYRLHDTRTSVPVQSIATSSVSAAINMPGTTTNISVSDNIAIPKSDSIMSTAESLKNIKNDRSVSAADSSKNKKNDRSVSAADNSKTRSNSQDWVTRTIKISQKPNSEKGFGFFLAGGVDKNGALHVSKVILGSAADVCDLRNGDVLVSVNQTDVSTFTTGQVGELVADSVSTGYIELQILREQEEDDLEDFTSSSEDEDNKSYLHKHQFEAHQRDGGNTQKLQTRENTKIVAHEDYMKKISGSTYSPNLTDGQTNESDFPYHGPPVLLRKWQQQMQNEANTLDTVGDSYSQIDQSIMFPLINRERIEDSIVASGIEEERERLLREELSKLQLERQRAEEELKNKEKEEEIRRERHEEELRKERELLRLEREKFLREKEEFNRLKEQELHFRKHQKPQEVPNEQNFLRRTKKSQVEQQNKGNFYPDPTILEAVSSQDSRQSAILSHSYSTQPTTEHKSIIGNFPFSSDQSPITHLYAESHNQQTGNQFRAKTSGVYSEPTIHQQTDKQIKAKTSEVYSEPTIHQQTDKQIKAKTSEVYSEPTIHQQTDKQIKAKTSGVYSEPTTHPETDKQIKAKTSEVYSEPTIHQQTDNQVRTTTSGVYSEPTDQQQTDKQIRATTSGVYSEPTAQQQADNSFSLLVKPFIVDDLEAPRKGQRLSREEIMVLNRTATPKDTLPIISNTGQTQGTYAPITREAPSREEIHSLNSVPKAKLRSDVDWQSSVSLTLTALPKSAPKHQLLKGTNQAPGLSDRDAKKSSKFTMTDHWLIEEAERRRMAESESRLQHGRSVGYRSSSGPIKPTSTSPNRWRESAGHVHYQTEISNQWQQPPAHVQNQFEIPETGRPLVFMPSAIRQTLLQKISGIHGSSDQVHSSSSSSPSSSPSFSQQDIYQGSSLSSPVHSQQFQQHQKNHSHHSHFPTQGTSTNHLYMQNTSPNQAQGTSPLCRQDTSTHSTLDTLRSPGFLPQNQKEVSISGSQLCSSCNQELGYGAAMVIESLGLFFHVQCFRCCVCHASLGTGDHGADVRIRANKLHCPNCYSNDEVGLKFSQV